MTEKYEKINNVAPLANVTRLTQLIIQCQDRTSGLPGMGCFYGSAGLGKTFAGTYATNKFKAVHVEALPIGGVKGLLTMIVKELGLRPALVTHALFVQAVEELAISDRPLIIDEADHILTDKTIDIVRRLHDGSGVPVILMGEEDLPQKLQRWGRVHSRMLSWVGAEQATIKDVDHLAAIYARGVSLSAELKARLLAASRGSIRNAATNLSNVQNFAILKGLDKIDIDTWGNKPFHTGIAPPPRMYLESKRGGVA